MVAARGRPCESEAMQPSSKRHCSRREHTVTYSAGCPRDAAEEFLVQFNLTGMASAEQPVGQFAWRCLSDFNVTLVSPLVSQSCMLACVKCARTPVCPACRAGAGNAIHRSLSHRLHTKLQADCSR
jgi:hypothetical protein